MIVIIGEIIEASIIDGSMVIRVTGNDWSNKENNYADVKLFGLDKEEMRRNNFAIGHRVHINIDPVQSH